jgi:hypothetical protein
MLIIEGGDNVGKTTLLRELLAIAPDLRLLHRDRYDPTSGEPIATTYFKALLPMDGDRVRHGFSVADRFVASECVYGSLFRKGCRLTLAEHHALEQMLVSYGAEVIWCDVTDETIKANWTDREQLYDKPLQIASAYRERMATIFPALPVRSYRWNDPAAEKRRATIISAHESTYDAEAMVWWSAMPFGIGCLRHPTLMLVGEQLSPRSTVPVPFISGPAGEFLAWSMQHVFAAWPGLRRKTYTTNAIKPNGEEMNTIAALRFEIEFLKPKLIIALGREAEERVGIATRHDQRRVVTIPHPQYWRRFQWAKRAEYATMINDAVTPLFRHPALKRTPTFYTHQETIDERE